MARSSRAEYRNEQPPVSEATVVEALRNQRRRYALYYLQNHDPPVALDGLVEQVAAWERTTTPENVDPGHRKSVYTSLHQTHLPYLEEIGLVTYDRGHSQVAFRVDSSTFGLYLANDPHTSIAWYKVYLALSVVGFAVVGSLWVEPGAISTVSMLTVATALLVGFAAVGLLHWYDIHRWYRRTEEMPPDFLVTLEDGVSRRKRDGDGEGDE